MLEYPFRTLGRTVATKLPYGPLRPATSRSDHRPLSSARSSSLRSLPRAHNSPGLPRDPVLQIKPAYPRMEETSDPPLWMPGVASGRIGMGHTHAGLRSGSLPSNRSFAGRLLDGTGQVRPECGRTAAVHDHCGLSLTSRTLARRTSGQRPRDPPPRSSAERPSRKGSLAGSDPRGRGQGCANTPGPEPAAGPRTAGSLPTPHHRLPAALVTRGAEAQDACVQELPLPRRCASPERRSAHRPPASFARSSTVMRREPLIGREPPRSARSAERCRRASLRCPTCVGRPGVHAPARSTDPPNDPARAHGCRLP